LGFADEIVGMILCNLCGRVSKYMQFSTNPSGSLPLKDSIWDVDGRRVVFSYTVGFQRCPSRYELTFTGSFFAHAKFRTETSMDGLLKDVGLNKEIQLNDPEFDRMVYIECEDKEFIARFLGSDEAKAHLRRILSIVTTFQIKGNQCVLVKDQYDGAAGASMEEIRTAAKSMIALVEKIPSWVNASEVATPLTGQLTRRLLFLSGVAVTTLVCGLGSVLFATSFFQPLLVGAMVRGSLFISAPLIIIFLWFVFVRVRNSSVASRLLWVAGLFGSVGIVLVCWGGMMTFNAILDTSDKVAHEVRVVSKFVNIKKVSDSHYVVVPAWFENGTMYALERSHSEYERLMPGAKCVITTRSGFLKYEWIVNAVCS
jgi:hypothetical protein